jgi:hypothetical protein
MVRDRSTLPVPTSSLDQLGDRVTASRPIRQDWTFTRHDVHARLDRLDQRADSRRPADEPPLRR